MPNRRDYEIEREVDFLESEQRKNLLSPKQILNTMPDQKDKVVLDAGAGSGYLTIPIAEQGAKEVVAYDSDADILQVITNKAQNNNLKNVTVMQGNLEDTTFENEKFDSIIAGFVLHEVELRPVLHELTRVLSLGGTITAIEFFPTSEETYHPRLAPEELEAEFSSQGLSVKPIIEPNKENYILQATKED